MAFKRTIGNFSEITFDCTQWFWRKGGLGDVIRKLVDNRMTIREKVIAAKNAR